MSQITATFSKLSLKDVKAFRLQSRPFVWVEFRNVSLYAGQKTDVQVIPLLPPLNPPLPPPPVAPRPATATDAAAKTLGDWIVVGTVTDGDGKPFPGVTIRACKVFGRMKTDVAKTTTDADGHYRIAFRLDRDFLSQFRGVMVEPVRDGFIDRELGKSGEFNALLYAGEKPRRPGDENAPEAVPENFAPGVMRRFAERDLVLGAPGRADFTLLPAGEITGEIVDRQGKPLVGCGIAVSVPGQRSPLDSVASASTDEQGRFRLKGIPFHKPLIFSVNPTGLISETLRTAPEKFPLAKTQHIRIVVQPGQKVDVRVVSPDASAAGASAPAGGALAPDRHVTGLRET